MGTPQAQVGGAGVAFGDVSTADLGFLLRAVISVPGAADDPSAGSLAGGLIAALVGRGADGVVEPYLTPGDSTVTFELRTYRVGSSVPVIRDDKVNGPEALRRMLDQGEPRGGHELVAHLEDGTEARVVVRLGDGPLVYQFAGRHGTALAVAKPAAAAPAAGLADAVREALADTTIEVDLGGIEDVVARAVANALPSALPAGAPTAVALAQAPAHAAGEVLVERLWLKVRGLSYQLRSTGEALARVEAAVERVDRPGSPPSERLSDVVGDEVERLRAQIGHLEAMLSRFDAGEDLVPGDNARR